MRRQFLILGAVYGLLLPAQAEPWTFTTVTAKVLGKDGKPVAGRKVFLLGTARESLMNFEQAGKQDGWNTVSDGDGRAVFKLGRFSTDDHLEKEKTWLPGWGEYFLVATLTEKDAGAVSPRLVHRKSGALPADKDPWGSPVTVTQEPLEIVLQLQEGITVTGKVQDLNGAPAADLAFSLFHDLGANTPTGVGGEIFRQDARSDRHGFFEFRKVYPAPFHLSLESVPPYWVQTRVGGQWQDGIMDEFEAGPKTREVLIGITVSSKKIYRYYGQVKNDRGKTIENAKIVLGVSEHRRSQTYRDEHNYVEVMTGADGRFEINVETPWVRGFSVEAAGHSGHEFWPDDGQTLKPGIYNFSLKTLK